jgi:RNA recognition motif-containing protein
MKNKLFVGNLAWSVADSDLEGLFSQYGTVQSSNVVMDKFTGKSRGFAFVEMGSDEEAQAAITALNGKDFQGREIAVNVARPKQ